MACGASSQIKMRLPWARVRFSSEYLWRRGAETALLNTHMFLWSLFQKTWICNPLKFTSALIWRVYGYPHDYDGSSSRDAISGDP